MGRRRLGDTEANGRMCFLGQALPLREEGNRSRGTAWTQTPLPCSLAWTPVPEGVHTCVRAHGCV